MRFTDCSVFTDQLFSLSVPFFFSHPKPRFPSVSRLKQKREKNGTLSNFHRMVRNLFSPLSSSRNHFFIIIHHLLIIEIIHWPVLIVHLHSGRHHSLMSILKINWSWSAGSAPNRIHRRTNRRMQRRASGQHLSMPRLNMPINVIVDDIIAVLQAVNDPLHRSGCPYNVHATCEGNEPSIS